MWLITVSGMGIELFELLNFMPVIGVRRVSTFCKLLMSI